MNFGEVKALTSVLFCYKQSKRIQALYICYLSEAPPDPLNEGEKDNKLITLFSVPLVEGESEERAGGVIKQLYKTYILSPHCINRNSGQKQKKYKKYQKSKFSSMLKN